MDNYEAFRLARVALFAVGNLETVAINGVGYAVPKERNPNGEAKHKEHQEYADAYNHIAGIHKNA